ncbi:PREDICTED: dapper homolog 2-like [Nanorana parkeri]|uniref:dapper homolog 2-like n=1 Tax=Nanorana parkeri TaxID=125878 RepID=UPI00085452D0|nr:PREDICTED: dapper homolog 2-like [Nanorana parkeri]
MDKALALAYPPWENDKPIIFNYPEFVAFFRRVFDVPARSLSAAKLLMCIRQGSVRGLHLKSTCVGLLTSWLPRFPPLPQRRSLIPTQPRTTLLAIEAIDGRPLQPALITLETAPLTMVVISSLHFPVVLGYRWLQTHNPRLDLGKSHLRNHLDQQISALKLDEDKSSTENLESDSRPSSGFYELSDISSCSLSNSCLSVYSECLSSASKVRPCSQKYKSHFKNFEYRPRSADEKSLCVYTGDILNIRINSVLSNIQGKESRRPVSTGDLERFIQLYHGFQNTSGLESMSTFDIKDDIFFQSVDPKYQNDLVSKNRNEIYTYPSPLHAVALQSPLFSLSTESQKYSTENNSKTIPGLLPRPALSAENKPKGHINKLLQIRKSQEIGLVGFCQRNAKKTHPALPHQTLISEHCPTGISNTSIFQRQSRVSLIEDNTKEQGDITKRELQPKEDAEKNLIVSENLKITLPVPSRRNPSLSTSHPNTVHQHKLINLNCSTNKAPQDSGQQMSYTSHKKHSPQKRIHAAKNLEHFEFVQAKFIPGESHQIKIRMSTSKNFLINRKRRNSEKRITPSPAHIVEEPVLREPIRLKDECIEHCKPKVGRKRSIKKPSFFVAATRRSYSKDSLYSDQCRTHRAQADTSPKILYSPNIMEAHSHLNIKHKWQSSVDISVNKHLCNFSRSPHTVYGHRKPVKKAGVKHCRHMDIHGQSESEYSAECSLFHSTVIETSDEVASEYTTNRFGDIGSSDSDSKSTTSGSSLSLNCESLNWADNTPKTPVAPHLNRHSQLEPKVSRIKASKALKKKIRRFHPTSLKIITMM